jgi:hypothetical protein
MTRWLWRIAVLFLTATTLGCSGRSSDPVGSSATYRTGNQPTVVATRPESGPGPPWDVLDCRQAIDVSAEPGDQNEVVLGGIALPTRSPLQANPMPGGRLFAKHGLVVRVGFEGDLIIPEAWREELTVGWGGPERGTSHLRIPGCTAENSATGWLAFAGGYDLPRPACVEVVVQTATRSETVLVGLGASCPGQGPPPPSAP